MGLLFVSPDADSLLLAHHPGISSIPQFDLPPWLSETLRIFP
jgi:hypothetical protein